MLLCSSETGRTSSTHGGTGLAGELSRYWLSLCCDEPLGSVPF